MVSESKNCYGAHIGFAEFQRGCIIEQAFFKIGDKTVCVDVHPWDTLPNLTDFILKRHGCPLDNHILMESGKVLRDYNCKIRNFNRKPLMIQPVLRFLGGAFQVTVKLIYKSTFCVSVSEVDTIDDLKSIVEKQSGIPRDDQLITVGEKVLNEGSRTIASYKVVKEAILQVTFRLRGERK